MHVVAYVAAASLYLAASARYAWRFARARPGVTALMTLIVYGGVACHLVGTALYWVRFAEPPLVGLGPSLASLALLISLALAGLGLFSSAQPIGLLLAPVAGLLLLLAVLVGIEPAGSVLAFRGSWLALHVSLSFLGYAGWVVGAAAALMYPLQLRQLKRRGLMQKVLHQPTARMRDAAEDGRERDIVEAASYLFGLEEGTDGR